MHTVSVYIMLDALWGLWCPNLVLSKFLKGSCRGLGVKLSWIWSKIVICSYSANHWGTLKSHVYNLSPFLGREPKYQEEKILIWVKIAMFIVQKRALVVKGQCGRVHLQICLELLQWDLFAKMPSQKLLVTLLVLDIFCGGN